MKPGGVQGRIRQTIELLSIKPMNHHSSSFLVVLACMSTLAFSQTPGPQQAITDPRQITAKPDANVEQGEEGLSLERLYTTRSVGRTAWSPDGKTVVFVSNLSGRDNLWLLPSEGGWPRQLTVSDERQTHPAWSPDGKWIAYQSDYGGDEQWDLFLVSPRNGQVANITKSRLVSEEDPAWSPDGRYLAYTVKPKTSSVREIDVFDTILHQVKHITANTPAGKWNLHPVWSKDARFLAYTREEAKGTNANIFVAEFASGTSTLETPHEGEKLYAAEDFAPGGNALLITSNAANGYENPGILDLRTRKIRWIREDRWETRGRCFSPDGKLAAFAADRDGQTDLYLRHLASGKTTRVAPAKGVNSFGGAESAFSPDGRKLLYYHNGATSPTDLRVHDLAAGKSTEVTHSLMAGVPADHMVTPFLVHYPSRDGRWTISAFLYVPRNMQRNQQNAAIVYLHGGPKSESLDSFDRFIQHIVNQGYMVIAPNYRGGTGYGKAFADADLLDMGGGDVEDVLAAADFLKQTGYPDPKKLIAMGAGYGGYMTLVAVAKAPAVWGAGVAIAPFANWFTKIQNEDPMLAESDRATMGDPQKNPDLFRERSPFFFVDQVQAPLLLLAGAEDPRSPKEETLQVAEAIRKRGGVADYRIYENEGHDLARVENQIDAFKRVTNFLKARVPPADCGCRVE